MSLDRYHSQFFAILYHEFREMYWRQDPGSRAVWDGVAHQRTLRDEFANAEFFGLAEYPAYILCIFNRLGHGPPDREAQLQIMDMRRDYVRRLLEQGNLPECQCDVAEDTIRVR